MCILGVYICALINKYIHTCAIGECDRCLFFNISIDFTHKDKLYLNVVKSQKMPLKTKQCIYSIYIIFMRNYIKDEWRM